MRARAAVAVLVLGLAATACGSDGGTSTPAPPGATTTVAGETLATYSRSGGIAGREFRVVVRPDGTFEGGTGKPGRGHLGGSALTELQGLVAAFAAAGPERTYGQVVPDGFVTSVEAGGASTTVLEGATPPTAVQQLVGFLAALERQLPR